MGGTASVERSGTPTLSKKKKKKQQRRTCSLLFATMRLLVLTALATPEKRTPGTRRSSEMPSSAACISRVGCTRSAAGVR